MKRETLLPITILSLIFAFLLFKVQDKSLLSDNTWQQWKLLNRIEYKDQAQQIYRRRIFHENYQKIFQHNKRIGKTYLKALNLFADLTQRQFQSKYLSSFQYSQVNIGFRQATQKSDGAEIDWVAQGAVSPVRTTGQVCAASYAWSALGAVQGINAVSTKNLTLFSWQQIIDCSQQFGNQGCQGQVGNTLEFIKQKGISTNSQYPFIGNPQKCKKQTGSFRIKDYKKIQTCEQLSESLLKSPVSVYVDASKFVFYSGGILNNCDKNLNLAVVLVGMAEDYWKLKLNWGVSWGQKGYIRISRGNTCGVCSMASSASL